MLVFSYVSAFCVEQTQQTTITRTDGNGTLWNLFANRYDKAVETHEGNVHTLTCSGNGNIVCDWVTPPPQNIALPRFVMDDMINYADQQMSQGTYIGTYVSNFVYNNQLYYRTTVWSGNQPGESTVQVFITPLEAE